MNACYFKEMIKEELCGSKDYIMRAIELRAMNPSWSKMLIEMSASELEHAKNLYGMWEEYYKKVTESYSEIPEYLSEDNKCITEMYAKESVEIKIMHNLIGK